MSDLDDLKHINDHYGHLVGDEVLVNFIRQVKNQLRSLDVVVRFGGDEFIIVLPGASKDDALKVAKRIRNAIIHDMSFIEKHQLKYSNSMGVYTFLGNENLKDIIQKADTALHHAKITGKNKIAHFSDLDNITNHTS